MSNLEIAKEILIAAINQGYLGSSDKNTVSAIREERTVAIANAFKEIHKAICEAGNNAGKYLDN